MRLTIRRAVPEDAPDVAELYLRSRQASLGAIPPLVHTDDETRSWVAEVVLPSHDVWVAEVDNLLAAILVLSDGWIEHLYVEPDRCGAGIGSTLVEHAKQCQPGGLQLWTFASNLGARRFYERHGFVAVEETDGSANEEMAPDVRYRWDGSAQNP